MVLQIFLIVLESSFLLIKTGANCVDKLEEAAEIIFFVYCWLFFACTLIFCISCQGIDVIEHVRSFVLLYTEAP